MHELSLIKYLLEMVEEMGKEKGFSRVESLRLSCGRLSCVDPQALRFAFSVESSGSPAEGARLDIELLPAVLYCFQCETEQTLAATDLQCPACGSREVILSGGTEELKLLEMEVE